MSKRPTPRKRTAAKATGGNGAGTVSLLGGRIEPVEIEEEIQRSYLDYAMSVIVGRALPDVRDGLKPVHRRILWSMLESGLRPDRPYRKSAAAVGEVMKKYHPHGDVAIYDALVRMAQDFSLRAPLIDPHGNFGSVDGDPPAAQRYTEARLAPIAMELLRDIESDTVDFVPNYDGYEMQPTVLPSRFPNLLVNGSGGIAVGMATNIPPHNLGEVADAAIALIDNPQLSNEDLCAYVMAPDFPTGGILYRYDYVKNPLTGAVEKVDAVRQMYAHGRGRVVVDGTTFFEEARGDRTAIIVSELPYQVNKSALIEKIADLVKEDRIQGIADLRDESDRDGMRIVIELKRDAVPDVVLNQLWRHTALQSSFAVNMIALNGGRPELLTLPDVDGGLVGGASLVAADFWSIAEAVG